MSADAMGTRKDGAEQQRLEQSRLRTKDWQRWGPYLSERQWGTVREDYSHDGSAWFVCSLRGPDGSFPPRGVIVCFFVCNRVLCPGHTLPTLNFIDAFRGVMPLQVVFTTRQSPFQSVSVGRGRTARLHRPSMSAVFLARLVERQRSDSERASLWPHWGGRFVACS